MSFWIDISCILASISHICVSQVLYTFFWCCKCDSKLQMCRVHCICMFNIIALKSWNHPRIVNNNENHNKTKQNCFSIQVKRAVLLEKLASQFWPVCIAFGLHVLVPNCGGKSIRSTTHIDGKWRYKFLWHRWIIVIAQVPFDGNDRQNI